MLLALYVVLSALVQNSTKYESTSDLSQSSSTSFQKYYSAITVQCSFRRATILYIYIKKTKKLSCSYKYVSLGDFIELETNIKEEKACRTWLQLCRHKSMVNDGTLQDRNLLPCRFL